MKCACSCVTHLPTREAAQGRIGPVVLLDEPHWVAKQATVGVDVACPPGGTRFVVVAEPGERPGACRDLADHHQSPARDPYFTSTGRPRSLRERRLRRPDDPRCRQRPDAQQRDHTPPASIAATAPCSPKALARFPCCRAPEQAPSPKTSPPPGHHRARCNLRPLLTSAAAVVVPVDATARQRRHPGCSSGGLPLRCAGVRPSSSGRGSPPSTALAEATS